MILGRERVPGHWFDHGADEIKNRPDALPTCMGTLVGDICDIGI